jgi:hypothetical protein
MGPEARGDSKAGASAATKVSEAGVMAQQMEQLAVGESSAAHASDSAGEGARPKDKQQPDQRPTEVDLGGEILQVLPRARKIGDIYTVPCTRPHNKTKLGK